MKSTEATILACLAVALLLPTYSAGSLRRVKRQIPPMGNGQVITSIFQIPIRTLDSVHDLLQSSRVRIGQIQHYYAQQAPSYASTITSLFNSYANSHHHHHHGLHSHHKNNNKGFLTVKPKFSPARKLNSKAVPSKSALVDFHTLEGQLVHQQK